MAMHRANTSNLRFDTNLIDALTSPEAFSHAVDDIHLMETHISWVILAGAYVYKIKKPLVLDFLDFGDLEKRRFFCNEEIRLNKPWAPDIYIDVVPITREKGGPCFGGSGEPLEYAVRMHRFDQRLRLDHQLERGELSIADMRELAENIARRHLAAPLVASARRERIVAQTKAFMRDNFAPLQGTIDGDELRVLRAWTERELADVDQLLWQRIDSGFVRDCHGDLHLGNLVRLPAGITTFDCIEFNSELRATDVFGDVGFLTMDLVARGRRDLAACFLNRYLECTGDYDGVVLLDLYFVYRCLVRAKVAAILCREHESEADKANDRAEACRYSAMAMRQISKPPPMLIVMSGLSGSGKTWVSEQLMAALPAVRIRSDIERKRKHDLGESEDSASDVGEGIYSTASTQAVYAYLYGKAGEILDAGHSVILDAAFLKREQRRQAARVARDRGRSIVLLRVDAPHEVLRDRLRTRAAAAEDASEAGLEVLQHQIENVESFDNSEVECALVGDNTDELDIAALLLDIRDLADRQREA